MSDIIRRMKKPALKAAEETKKEEAMERITVRVPGDVRDSLQALAKKEDRDYTEYARRVLTAHVRQAK